MKKISILIADDHKLIRETWSYILNSDPRFKVISECANVEDAVEMAEAKSPNIVLMDINIPPTNGFDATEKIHAVSPSSMVIGVSMHSQPAYAKKMLQLGGSGYLTKNSSKEEMFTAIMEVSSGKHYVCDEIKNIMAEHMADENLAGGDLTLLTEREVGVVNCIREGLSSREIADKLDISVKTVEVHRHNILKKLNVKNATTLINLVNNSNTFV
jgi:DNA-binding NarL/FixJ family response regulator